MRDYTIELLWRCRFDKTLNRGLAAYCEGCGKPKRPDDEEVWPDNISEDAAIRDPEQLRLAKAGPDWACKFCGTRQNSTGLFCIHCGADRQSGARSWQALETTVTEDLRTGHKTTATRGTTVSPRIYPEERRSLGPWTRAPLGRDSEEIRQTDSGATVCRVWKDHPGCWAYEVSGGEPCGVHTRNDAKDAADSEARVQGWALQNQVTIEIPPEIKPDYPVEPPSPTAGYRSAPRHTRPSAGHHSTPHTRKHQRIKSPLEQAVDDIDIERTARRIKGSRKTGGGWTGMRCSHSRDRPSHLGAIPRTNRGRPGLLVAVEAAHDG